MSDVQEAQAVLAPSESPQGDRVGESRRAVGLPLVCAVGPTMTSKVTGPLFKWFGSKWLASKLYPAPEHDTIFEPFAGSAGYSLRHHEKKVVLWEDNLQLRELWTWLIGRATSADVLEIPIKLRVGRDIRKLDLSVGQALLLKHWQRTNNVGECWTVSPWGNKPGQWTANTRARVAEELHAVKHWVVRRVTYVRSGTYFLDPPYLYNYRYRFAPESFDHTAFAKTLVSRIPKRSQIIVCEAACQKTGRVPKYLPFKPFASRITSRRKTTENHHSKEYLYYEQR
jgi:hypothetical protein